MDAENVVYMYNGILFTTKKNEFLSFTGKWIELETIMLSEISQTERDKYCVFSLLCGF
jgi:hypothetical protein